MHPLRLLTILLFTVIGGIYLFWSWSCVLGGFGGDNAHYLFMASHYSPFSETTEVTEYFAHNSIYPPLFPLLLGFTGGGESLLAAHIATTACLLGAFGVFYWWLRRDEIGRLVSLTVLLVWSLVPAVYMQTLSVHSENLYLLCSLSALAFSSAIKRESRDRTSLIIAFAAVAASYLTRGAGLSLVAAWLAWLWLNSIPGRIGFSLFAMLPVFLWSKFGGTASTDYWGQLAFGYQDTSRLLTQLWEQARHLLDGWFSAFGSGTAAWVAGSLLLIFGLPAAVWRTWLCRLDGLYVCCYLGMILLWPFPAEAQRMLFVLLPVLLWQTAWLFQRCRAAARVISLVQGALWIVLLVAVLPPLVQTGRRFLSPLPPNVPESFRRTEGWYAADLHAAESSVESIAAVEAALRKGSAKVPADACIFSVKPSVVAYLSGRLSKEPPEVRLEQSAFDRELQARGCRYFYLMAFATPSYPVVMYPYQRLQSRLEVIESTVVQEPNGRKAAIALLARLK